ncbi:nuclear protein [Clydaea vesicula]|uniref:Non-structural maintenance of chromosomes element 4 n=1 Tax=Clydaea vesicula TaxID=447962 RepID=A0AAD5Y468_9FUNG|nr:nuclear protein [Clydaea vesicula]KAJ3396976.1 nuclear protein [Lobulomyces angularis]
MNLTSQNVNDEIDSNSEESQSDMEVPGSFQERIRYKNKRDQRTTRNGYRVLLNECQLDAREVNATDLMKQIEHANTLFEKGTSAPEFTLDSKFLVLASETAVQKIRSLKSDSNSFDAEEWMHKVNKKLQFEESFSLENTNDLSQKLNWKNNKFFNELTEKYLKKVPTTGFMLGPLAVEKKKKEIKKIVRHAKVTEEVSKPQELNEKDIEKEENETSSNVRLLLRVLQELEVEEINFFKFIINPHSFSQTVENLFYLSFLIKDNRIKIVVDGETAEPKIEFPDSDDENDDDDSEVEEKKQLIMTIDHQLWKDAIEFYNIKECIIPNRSQIIETSTKWN